MQFFLYLCSVKQQIDYIISQLRTSGTEPLVRVMIEGKDIEKMDKAAKKLASLIEERLK